MEVGDFNSGDVVESQLNCEKLGRWNEGYFQKESLGFGSMDRRV
jgi:hypothetical protein